MNEFFQRLHDWFGIDSNTSATILITIIVFGLGLIATWVSKKFKDNIDRSNYRKSLNHIIYNCAIACQKQSESLASKLPNSGFINGNNYIFPIITNNTIGYLNKVNLQLMVNNYVIGYNKRVKSQAIAEFYDIIGGIAFHLDNNKNIETYIEAYKNYLKSYNVGVDFLREVNERIIAEALSFSAGKVSNSSFEGKYHAIFNKWFVDGAHFTMSETHNKLIIPISALLPNHVASTKVFFDISNAVNKAKSAYSDIEKIDGLLNNEFEIRKDAFEKASDQLLKILNRINFQKRLFFFKYIDLDKSIYKIG